MVLIKVSTKGVSKDRDKDRSLVKNPEQGQKELQVKGDRWDCSLNICVVPPHIYMSLFARQDNALRQGSEDEAELQSLSESVGVVQR